MRKGFVAVVARKKVGNRIHWLVSAPQATVPTVVVGRPWGVMTLPVVGQLRGEGETVSPCPSVVPSATDGTPDRSAARRRALAAPMTVAGEVSGV